MTLDELNTLSAESARLELERCCGSQRWASIVAARRPFRSRDELLQVATEVWSSLDEQDWLEAFSHHPRIGERADGWALAEQAGTQGASESTRLSLAALNRQYEEMFGYVFLICATGKSADEMLSALRQRLTNDPGDELRVAASEQEKIMRLRLEKLLSAPMESSRSK